MSSCNMSGLHQIVVPLAMHEITSCHGVRIRSTPPCNSLCPLVLCVSIIYALTCTVCSFLGIPCSGAAAFHTFILLELPVIVLVLHVDSLLQLSALPGMPYAIIFEWRTWSFASFGAHGSALFLPTKPPCVNFALTRPGSVL
jgi:hypothetical protein